MFKNRKILVTGGTGLIGRPLVQMLLEAGAHVRIASLDDASRAHPDAEFMKVDLMHLQNCVSACQDMQDVFHLAGVKGSPAMTANRPASFFTPMLSFNTNMLEAARRADVERYLYTSSIGVYAPAEKFYENDVWSTFPSPNDRFAGWAKRMGELQTEAYKIEHDWNAISIVRPANVYGAYDNFDPNNAMVIPSLIRRALDGENPLVVWGDGTAVRDFIHAKDVAKGMMLAVEKGITEPLNLGSGQGVSVREIVDAIVLNMDKKPKIEWDVSKPSGDRIRIMDTQRAKSYGIQPKINLKEGIKEVMDWYLSHKSEIEKRYNVFQNRK